jgi:hypothetical protein
MLEPCDPATAIIPCPTEPGGGGGGSPTPSAWGVSVGYTWQSCLAPAADVDHDGLDDTCETRLVAAFAPGMIVDPYECGWDPGLNRVGGEYYYMVKRPPGQLDRIRIAYLPAYYRDCGSGGHTGDSEFIGVDVKWEVNNVGGYSWQFQGAYLSAHCGAEFMLWGAHTGYETDPDCQYLDRWWWENALGGGAYVDMFRGAPRVWVSSGKHANYHSRGHCESGLAGTFGVDHCYTYQQLRRFPVVYRWQNVDFPESGAFGHVYPRWGSAIPDPNAWETFTETLCDQVACYKFNGWVRPSAGGGSTPYWQAFRFYLGMWYTSYAAPPSECTPYDPATAFIPTCP